MFNREPIVEFDKEGCAHIICEPTDERFLDYLGDIFRACMIEWKITSEELGELIEKYHLATYIYNDFIYLCNYGILGIVRQIEDYIKQESGKK